MIFHELYCHKSIVLLHIFLSLSLYIFFLFPSFNNRKFMTISWQHINIIHVFVGMNTFAHLFKKNKKKKEKQFERPNSAWDSWQHFVQVVVQAGNKDNKNKTTTTTTAIKHILFIFLKNLLIFEIPKKERKKINKERKKMKTPYNALVIKPNLMLFFWL